jgi:CMP-N-acetylneuraminic acid synthetase
MPTITKNSEVVSCMGLKELYYEVKSYIEHKGVQGKIYPLICPEHEVQDIDTEEDWKMAELKVEYIKRSES